MANKNANAADPVVTAVDRATETVVVSFSIAVNVAASVVSQKTVFAGAVNVAVCTMCIEC